MVSSVYEYKRMRWEVDCEYMGCRETATHKRWTAGGVEKEYCRHHHDEADRLFGSHSEPPKQLSYDE